MNFKYRAQDKQGQIVIGIVQAKDQDEANRLLEDKGFGVLEIKVSTAHQLIDWSVLRRVAIRDLVAFYRALAMMLASDVSIVESLKIISSQTKNQKMNRVLVEVYHNVNEGMRFSDAMSAYPKIFGEFYIHMIRSGEVTGKLEEVLSYLADQQVKDYEFKAKIRGAMSYPIFVLSAMFIMGTGVLGFVIPKLTVMLIESGVSLPWTTRFLIAVSDFVKDYWYIVIFGTISIVTGSQLFFKRTLLGRKLWHKMLMNMPIFGASFIRKIYLVRLTRSLNMLVIGGVPLVEAIEISSSVVGNYYYEKMMKQTAESVKDGNNIATVFGQHPELIPEMLTQLTMIGEQSGRLDQVFEKVGDFYAKEVDNTVQNISKMIEPIIMVVLGLAVAFLVMSIMLPMFKATQAMG